LTDSTYDLLRTVVEKAIPAAGVLYAVLAGYWGWANVIPVTGSLAAVAVFLGVLLSLSRKGYSPEPAPKSYDGEITLTGVSADGAPIAQIKLTDDAQQNFLTKPVLTIKGFDENA
jgi:hypothetical protein